MQFRDGIGGNLGPPLRDSTPAASSSQAFDGQAWINAYRAAQNMPDLFGRSTWPSDRGTVAVTEIDGKLYFGVNSRAPGYMNADENAARSARNEMIKRYPSIMETDNIGEVPNDSLFHAEATVLLRSANDNGGTLADKVLEVHVDRGLCTSCIRVLPRLGLELGNPWVTFVDTTTGRRSAMHNGRWLQ